LFFEESQINDDLLPMSFAPSHTDDIDLETYITDVNDMQKMEFNLIKIIFHMRETFLFAEMPNNIFLLADKI
jgi:hypothetical protein